MGGHRWHTATAQPQDHTIGVHTRTPGHREDVIRGMGVVEGGGGAAGATCHTYKLCRDLHIGILLQQKSRRGHALGDILSSGRKKPSHTHPATAGPTQTNARTLIPTNALKSINQSIAPTQTTHHPQELPRGDTVPNQRVVLQQQLAWKATHAQGLTRCSHCRGGWAKTTWGQSSGRNDSRWPSPSHPSSPAPSH